MTAEPVFLAVGEAMAFTAVDTGFVAQGRIRPVYLLDALAQIILIAAWALALLREHKT